MVQVINANSLSLREVRQRFQFEPAVERDFSKFLTLSPLTPVQRDRIAEIRGGWQHYQDDSKVSEGQVGVLAVSPILWASGYASDPDICISVETNIEDIALDDDETVIRGRMDMVVNQRWNGDQVPFCILVIETKNNAAHTSVGLPQLLTYTGTFLENQDTIWGLLTNGMDYQYVLVEKGIYRQFPVLSFLLQDQAEEMLQVAIAIRKQFKDEQDKK